MSFHETVRYIWNNPIILTILALVFAPLFGGVLMSLDRRITARMQGRMGPPSTTSSSFSANSRWRCTVRRSCMRFCTLCS